MARKVRIPNYTLGEEITNSITHGIGAIFALVALILMIAKAAVNGNTTLCYTVLSVYGACMLVTYVISCVYHGLSPKLKGKGVLRVIDHCDVYMLVLGTITPVALLGVKGFYGWLLFGLASALTIVGIVFTAIDVDKYSKVSVFCHLLCGWCVLFFVRLLVANADIKCLYLILAGGISYSVGALLYWLGKKIKYMHSIFHVFVLAGSVLQWLAIYLYLI